MSKSPTYPSSTLHSRLTGLHVFTPYYPIVSAYPCCMSIASLTNMCCSIVCSSSVLLIVLLVLLLSERKPIIFILADYQTLRSIL